MEENTTAFKKPVLIGKVGKLPKKVLSKVEKSQEPTSDGTNCVSVITAQTSDDINKDTQKTDPKVEENVVETKNLQKEVQCPYTEPLWSGSPDEDTKYGLEILKQGSIIGNHNLEGKNFFVFGRLPQCDISMAHPTISRYHAILQYRKEDTEQDKKGYYLYDLGSTHGTFLNKLRLKSQKYVRVQVGHMIKLGCSSRSYILTGPEEDQEAESEFTITELKQHRKEELERREQLVKDAQVKAEAERLEQEKRDEERGVDWGMGEDADVESDLAENPYAQTNNEELYLDDPKKALRGFMEREGLDLEYDCTEQGLGQFLCKVVLPVDDERGRSIVAEVLHKGKKKEAVVQCALEACRILDRHGVLRQANHESKKRKAKNWQENDYYDSDEDTFLDRTGTIERKRENRMKAKQPQQAETYQSLLSKEHVISERINTIQAELAASQSATKTLPDDVDSLDSFMADLKQPKLEKDKAMQLKTELVRLKQNHAQVIKLVNIARPADLPPLKPQYNTHVSKEQGKSKFPMFGKRLKVKVEKPTEKTSPQADHDNDNDDDNDDVGEEKTEAGTMHVDQDIKEPATSEKLEQLTKKTSEVKETELILKTIETKTVDSGKSPEMIEEVPLEKISPQNIHKSSKYEEEQRRKRNQRRIAQREEKLEKEKQRGYAEDYKKEDYNMWVPPEDQTGDGKTSLNEKFGY